MSIQTRLLKQRYSTMNLRTPTKTDLIDNGLPSIRFKSTTAAKLSSIKDILLFPPSRDKYFSSYITLVRDFYAEVEITRAEGKQPRVESELYNQQLVRKLAYYIKNPQYFGSSFEHYAITWMFNLQMSMRSYIMRQRIARGELPPIWNKCNFAQTKGHYKPPMPMNNPAMLLIGNLFWDLCVDDAYIYLSKV